MTVSANRPCRTEILFQKQLRQPANLFQPENFIPVHTQLRTNTFIRPAQPRQVPDNIETLKLSGASPARLCLMVAAIREACPFLFRINTGHWQPALQAFSPVPASLPSN